MENGQWQMVDGQGTGVMGNGKWVTMDNME
jgi:hypothetical protein